MASHFIFVTVQHKHQHSSLILARMPHHPRILADGWGDHSTGNVFCADSSLRYLYERDRASLEPHARPSPAIARSSHDKSTSPLLPPPTCPGKRWRGSSTTSLCNSPPPHVDVDVAAAELARVCTTIRKQAAALPPSRLECCVCLSSNAVAAIAGCGHTFHPQCLLRWWRTNRSCPVCRGPVDRVQWTSAMADHDELEAIMAESDDDDESVAATSDPFLSLLGAEFETDMAFLALDALSPDAGALAWTFKHETDTDANDLDMMEECMETGPTSNVVAMAMQDEAMVTPGTPQFPPMSAMPNYWNVLDQGTARPRVPPPALAVPPQRMVHIVPKPDATKTQRSPAVCWTTQETMNASALQVPVQILNPSHHYAVRASTPAAPRVSCRCTRGCRNGRCACVKEGGMCGASCRCTSCRNPFLMVKAAGADIDALLKDDCFMHNVSKTRDMVQRLQEPVAVPCCEGTIKVIDCVQGYTCAPCKQRYDFSWCMDKLLLSERTPRNHCAICKRCCDHRDAHCHNCGRCYFAGVAASLPCPCKEASNRKKRREAAAKDKAEDADDEAEGECCIM